MARSDSSDDALRGLGERLDRASRAAERLVEAAGSARKGSAHTEPARKDSSGRPPPAGWQSPFKDDAEHQDDGELLVQLVVKSLRELIPPDLEQRLAAALREVLLALRALIDWYLERMERRRAEPAEVQDIPIL